MIVRTANRPLSSSVSNPWLMATSRASRSVNHCRTRPSSAAERVRRRQVGHDQALGLAGRDALAARSRVRDARARAPAAARVRGRSRASLTSSRLHSEAICSACPRKSRACPPFRPSQLAYPNIDRGASVGRHSVESRPCRPSGCLRGDLRRASVTGAPREREFRSIWPPAYGTDRALRRVRMRRQRGGAQQCRPPPAMISSSTDDLGHALVSDDSWIRRDRSSPGAYAHDSRERCFTRHRRRASTAIVCMTRDPSRTAWR